MPEELTLPQKLFIDHLIMYLRDTFPARWAELVKSMPAENRRHFFTQIAFEALSLAERRYHAD